MMISLSHMVKTYDLKINGVIHIGAHYGEEYKAYRDQGIMNMLFFEPVKANYQQLIRSLPIGWSKGATIISYNIALGNEVGYRNMYIETANQGLSCSLLESGTHLSKYPKITFKTMENVEINKLDNIVFNRKKFNMINIDVQGYELEVFKGAVEVLKNIDIIYSEVNFEEVYKNCCLVQDLDGFLGSFGFMRVLTDDKPKAWGDALYLKYDGFISRSYLQ